jgi:hypothetical protein
LRDLLPAEGRQVIARRHALRQLPQVPLSQKVVELRLSDEHNLNQFLRIGLEIRDQANLLENIAREILCFVDDENDVLALAPGLEQELVERIDQLLVAFAFAGDTEVPIYRAEELLRTERRIEDECTDRVFVQPIQKVAAQRRLSRPDLAGNGHEATTLSQTELEMSECLIVVAG